MAIHSKTVQEKHDLIRKLESMNGQKKDKKVVADLQKKIDDLEQKHRQEIQDRLEKHQSQVVKIEEQFEEARKPDLKITVQYRALCAVYKEAMRVVQDIRDSKKAVREEMKKRRKTK
jgi:hypothetical protein